MHAIDRSRDQQREASGVDIASTSRFRSRLSAALLRNEKQTARLAE